MNYSIKFLTIIVFQLGLIGCAAPQENNRRALLTPYERCVEDAEMKTKFCRVSCFGQGLYNRGSDTNSCDQGCEQTKNLMLQSCAMK